MIKYNAKNLRRLKFDNEITSVELAKNLDVHFNTITKYTTGRVCLSAVQIETLCNLYNVEPSYFYDTINS